MGRNIAHKWNEKCPVWLVSLQFHSNLPCLINSRRFSHDLPSQFQFEYISVVTFFLSDLYQFVIKNLFFVLLYRNSRTLDRSSILRQSIVKSRIFKVSRSKCKASAKIFSAMWFLHLSVNVTGAYCTAEFYDLH